MLGFKFGGIHCSEFGICMRSKNRPVLALPKIVTENLAGRDGSLDFSAANPGGRVLYNDRELSIDCCFVADSFSDIRKKSRDIAAWLAGGAKVLELDDEPNLFYNAKVINRLDFTQQFKRGYFTIIFGCSPFAYGPCEIGTAEDGDAYNNFDVTANRTIIVQNPGVFVNPLILVDGNFRNLRFEHGNKALVISTDAAGTMQTRIDCDNMTVTRGTQNMLPLVSGEFIELQTGENEIFVRADAINARIRFEFCPRYY